MLSGFVAGGIRMQFGELKRREFITVLGGAAAWPAVARAEQRTIPVVGFVTGLSSNYVAGRKPAFRQGLREVGYIEGQNVAVEYHSVEGQSGRLSGVVADLIDRKVAVIVAVGGTDPAKAAKAATTTIPIVFISAADPLGAGIVTRLIALKVISRASAFLAPHWRQNVWGFSTILFPERPRLGCWSIRGFPMPISSCATSVKRLGWSSDKSMLCVRARKRSSTALSRASLGKALEHF